MNYLESGVNVDLASFLLNNAKRDISLTKESCNRSTGGSILNANDYCSCVSLNALRYEDPILTFSTDGVGSKLVFADKFPSRDSNIVQDLFAMVFNDVICSGSRPLYFLDYYATNSLSEKISLLNQDNRFSHILQDLTRLCSEYEVALIGGETAEIPMIYSRGKYDLAGFGVGIVERKDLITPMKVRDGDVIIGITSSGPHSNGYTLINSIDDDLSYEAIEQCLKPTRIYVKPILDLMQTVSIHGLAHITGGGLTENLPRVIRDDLCGIIDLYNWKMPEVFEEISRVAGLSIREMLKTFNCGIGMVVIVAERDCRKTLEVLDRHFKSHRIGFVCGKKNHKIEYWGERL